MNLFPTQTSLLGFPHPQPCGAGLEDREGHGNNGQRADPGGQEQPRDPRSSYCGTRLGPSLVLDPNCGTGTAPRGRGSPGLREGAGAGSASRGLRSAPPLPVLPRPAAPGAAPRCGGAAGGPAEPRGRRSPGLAPAGLGGREEGGGEGPYRDSPCCYRCGYRCRWCRSPRPPPPPLCARPGPRGRFIPRRGRHRPQPAGSPPGTGTGTPGTSTPGTTPGPARSPRDPPGTGPALRDAPGAGSVPTRQPGTAGKPGDTDLPAPCHPPGPSPPPRVPSVAISHRLPGTHGDTSCCHSVPVPPQERETCAHHTRCPRARLTARHRQPRNGPRRAAAFPLWAQIPHFWVPPRLGAGLGAALQGDTPWADPGGPPRTVGRAGTPALLSGSHVAPNGRICVPAAGARGVPALQGRDGDRRVHTAPRCRCPALGLRCGPVTFQCDRSSRVLSPHECFPRYK